jgi:hypothetical protein
VRLAQGLVNERLEAVHQTDLRQTTALALGM